MSNTAHCHATDEALVTASQQGDASAFPTLIERYAKIVGAIAKKYNFVSVMEYEDLWQEGMIALYRAVQTYRGDEGALFRTYANRVIEHRMIDIVRRFPKKDIPASQKTIERRTEELQVDISALEKEYEQDEQLRKYLKVLQGTLSSYEYQVLSAYVQNYSYEQIARMLGTNQKSVDNALQRIRHKLNP